MRIRENSNTIKCVMCEKSIIPAIKIIYYMSITRTVIACISIDIRRLMYLIEVNFVLVTDVDVLLRKGVIRYDS